MKAEDLLIGPENWMAYLEGLGTYYIVRYLAMRRPRLFYVSNRTDGFWRLIDVQDRRAL